MLRFPPPSPVVHASRLRLDSRPHPPPNSLTAKTRRLSPSVDTPFRSAIIRQADLRQYAHEAERSLTKRSSPLSYDNPKPVVSPVGAFPVHFPWCTPCERVNQTVHHVLPKDPAWRWSPSSSLRLWPLFRDALGLPLGVCLDFLRPRE